MLFNHVNFTRQSFGMSLICTGCQGMLKLVKFFPSGKTNWFFGEYYRIFWLLKPAIKCFPTLCCTIEHCSECSHTKLDIKPGWKCFIFSCILYTLIKYGQILNIIFLFCNGHNFSDNMLERHPKWKVQDAFWISAEKSTQNFILRY